jgi:hypothetical protein
MTISRDLYPETSGVQPGYRRPLMRVPVARHPHCPDRI